MKTSKYQTLNSSQGSVAYQDTGESSFSVVLIHGNSCSSAVFNKQISAFHNRYRMIAIDLLGHGMSGRPHDPQRSYSIPGYAETIHEVINHLGLGPFAIVGFSLGGNIALQFSQIASDLLKGVMLISCAPIKYSAEALIAYPPYEGNFAGYPDQLTELQAKQFMRASGFHIDDPSVYFMIEDAMKTDGKARERMVSSVLCGRGMDETEIVSRLAVPLAVVVGKRDKNLGIDHIAGLNYYNLWRRKIEFIEEAEHAIPVHQSNQLHTLLEAFLKDIEE